MYELGIKSLKDAEDLTWREYHLLRAGYYRQQEREWEKVRFISYQSRIGMGSLDPKKVSIFKFMPLNSDPKKTIVSNSSKEAFIQAQKKYIEDNVSRT